MHVAEFFLILVVILASAKLLGEVAERLGQPAVLGELVAGVLLGSSLLGIVDPGNEVLHLLAELGVVILLFEIGLETDLKRLVAVGPAASVVAVVGVAAPFGLGLLVSQAFGLPTLPSLVVGAALTATSVGITARVLSDLGRLDDPEGQIVLGAAVIDDVLGLIILAIVGGIVAVLVLARTPQATTIETGIVRIGHFFVPIFFVAVGAAVDVRSFADVGVALFGIALVAVAILGKVIAGFAPWWFEGRKLVVGVGMVPRGEVGLIFAQMGLTAGVLDPGRFSALMLMVMATTFVAPPALKALLGPRPRPDQIERQGVAELTTEA